MITTLSPAGSSEAVASAPGPCRVRARADTSSSLPPTRQLHGVFSFVAPRGRSPHPPNYTMPATDRRTTHSSAADSVLMPRQIVPWWLSGSPVRRLLGIFTPPEARMLLVGSFSGGDPFVS